MSDYFINREKSALRLGRLLVMNAVVLLVLCVLVTKGAFSLYPWMAVGVVLLVIFDLLVAWRAPLHGSGSLGGPTHVPKLLWVAAVVFTAAGIAAVYKFISNPDTLSATQALIACVLVGYIWFLVNRLRRGRKGRTNPGSAPPGERDR